jgi:hypothetical protein
MLSLRSLLDVCRRHGGEHKTNAIYPLQEQIINQWSAHITELFFDFSEFGWDFSFGY